MDQQQKPAKIKLTALWSKTLSNGTTIMTGKLGDSQIEIWPNQYKQKENQPDFNVFLAPAFKKNDSYAEQLQPGGNLSHQYSDDIPF